MGMNIKGTGGAFNIKNNGGGGSFKAKIVVPPVLDIETSGLVLHLDAGNAASYPGSGATWYDISGNGKDATLYASPTYSSNNGGTLSFVPGSSQYAEGSALVSLSNFTATVWTKFNNLPGSGAYPGVFTDIGTYPAINWSILFYGAPSNLSAGYYEGSVSGWHLVQNYSPSTGTWYNLTVTYDGSNIKFYVNGSSFGTTASTAAVSSLGTGYRVACAPDATSNNALTDATVAKAAVYNRALSDSEVLSNYNAIASRFA